MNFTTIENPLAKEERDFVARPVNILSHNLNDMIEEITRSGSILKKTETTAVIDSYWNNIGRYIEKGQEYRDEYVSVTFSISGTFMEEETRFDPRKHKLNVNINVNPKIQARSEQVELYHVDYERALPVIESVFDTTTESSSRTITPGGILAIEGNRLKIYDHSLTEPEGVFFVNKETSEEVKSTYIFENKPKRLLIKTPQLAAGDYQIVVKNTTHSSTKARVGYSPFNVKVL